MNPQPDPHNALITHQDMNAHVIGYLQEGIQVRNDLIKLYNRKMALEAQRRVALATVEEFNSLLQGVNDDIAVLVPALTANMPALEAEETQVLETQFDETQLDHIQLDRVLLHETQPDQIQVQEKQLHETQFYETQLQETQLQLFLGRSSERTANRSDAAIGLVNGVDQRNMAGLGYEGDGTLVDSSIGSGPMSVSDISPVASPEAPPGFVEKSLFVSSPEDGDGFGDTLSDVNSHAVTAVGSSPFVGALSPVSSDSLLQGLATVRGTRNTTSTTRHCEANKRVSMETLELCSVSAEALSF